MCRDEGNVTRRRRAGSRARACVGEPLAKRSTAAAPRGPARACPAQRARDGAVGELAPETSRLQVVEHLVRLVEETGNAERERPACDAAIEDERARAERTPGDDERAAADDVVHDLVQREQLDGVRVRVASHLDADHEVARLQETAPRLRRLESRVQDGGDLARRCPAHEIIRIEPRQDRAAVPGAQVEERSCARVPSVDDHCSGSGEHENGKQQKPTHVPFDACARESASRSSYLTLRNERNRR